MESRIANNGLAKRAGGQDCRECDVVVIGGPGIGRNSGGMHGWRGRGEVVSACSGMAHAHALNAVAQLSLRWCCSKKRGARRRYSCVAADSGC